MAGYVGWATEPHASEEVESFRVTLPRSQLSTLVLNGGSPAAAKLAAHGVVCEVSFPLGAVRLGCITGPSNIEHVQSSYSQRSN